MCKFVHGCCCLFNYLHIFCMASVFACFRYIFLLLLARVFTRVCIIFHLSESLYVCVCVLWVSVFMCFVYIFVVGSFWQKKIQESRCSYRRLRHSVAAAAATPPNTQRNKLTTAALPTARLVLRCSQSCQQILSLHRGNVCLCVCVCV